MSARSAWACPGALPVLNRKAVELAVRAALALGLHGAPRLGVRAQALLLSGPAQGLPDLAVRPAAGDRRRASPSTGRTAAPRPASPASTWRRTPASRCTTASSADRSPASISIAAACRSSRSSPSPTSIPAPTGRRLFQPHPRGARRARRQRRQHGGGQPALRRERLGPARRRCAARREDRDQEHQLVPLRAAGARVRDRRARSRCSTAGGRSSRRRGCGTAPPAGRCRCAARKRRTTTATSRSRTCRRCWSAPRGLEELRANAARAAGADARAVRSRSTRFPPYDAGVLTQSPALAALLRGDRGRVAAIRRRRATGSWAKCSDG